MEHVASKIERQDLMLYACRPQRWPLNWYKQRPLKTLKPSSSTPWVDMTDVKRLPLRPNDVKAWEPLPSSDKAMGRSTLQRRQQNLAKFALSPEDKNQGVHQS